MKYFLESDIVFDEDGDADFANSTVFFDSSSGEKIGACSYSEMFDEDTVRYLNLDEVSEDKDSHIAYCTEGMDSFIKFKLEEEGILNRKWEQALENLQADFKDSQIYPFVSEEDFYDALSDSISDAAAKMWNCVANDEEYSDEDEDYEGYNDGYYDPSDY